MSDGDQPINAMIYTRSPLSTDFVEDCNALMRKYGLKGVTITQCKVHAAVILDGTMTKEKRTEFKGTLTCLRTNDFNLTVYDKDGVMI